MVKHARSLWWAVCCAFLFAWAGPSPAGSKPLAKPTKPIQPSPPPAAAARSDGADLLKLLATSLDAPNDPSLRAQIDDSVKRIRQRVVHQVVIADFKNLSGDVELHARFTEGLFSYLNGHAPPDVKIVDRELGESLKAMGVALPVLASIGGSVYSLRIETQQEVGANVKVASRKVYNPARMDIAYRLNTLDSNLPHWQGEKEAREEALVPSLLSGVRRWQSAGEFAESAPAPTPAPATSGFGSIVPRQYQPGTASPTPPSHTTETLMERADVLSSVLGNLAHTGEVQEIQRQVSSERSRLIEELGRQPEFVEEPIYAPGRSAVKAAVWVIHIRILSPDGLEVLQDQELSETDVAFAQYTTQEGEASPALSGLPTDLDMRERVVARLIERAGRWITDTAGSCGLAHYDVAIRALDAGDTATGTEKLVDFLVSGSSRLYPQNTAFAISHLTRVSGLADDRLPVFRRELCRLLQVRLPATIDVTSEPAGASVSVDGVPTGKVTPCSLEVDMPAETERSVELRIEKEGHAPASCEVPVRAGAKVSHAQTLTVIKGHLEITVLSIDWPVEGARFVQPLVEEIQIDGTSIGRASHGVEESSAGLRLTAEASMALRCEFLDSSDRPGYRLAYRFGVDLTPGPHTMTVTGDTERFWDSGNFLVGKLKHRREGAWEASAQLSVRGDETQHLSYTLEQPGKLRLTQ